ncbi:sigma-54 dependent transcriptional regulator [Hyalangium sp.]|uniref:sigma-54 dependent transcriptional regulator n=1 Tax=Hyalangium sp. TaxID=2028555 RepID=UPI002D34CEC9|nr:sigma-54 dependent transcriptional regulator [Hyalangium sp.]HYI02314.1 sigma-54 dependent transcriptional regulator [Hyalangium sp.]
MSEKPLVEVSTIDRDAPVHGLASARPVLALTIVSHPMARRAGERVLLEELEVGQEASVSRSSPDFGRPGQAMGRPLADPFLSRKPLWLQPMPGGGVRLRASESGLRVVVAGEPLLTERELPLEALERGVPLELSERVVVLLHRTPGETAPGEDLGMVGQSGGMRRVREDIARVADLDMPVLIRGETGAGKELVARALHQRSPRHRGRFVSVNMGALPKELAAAELFGARRGAYTGANQDREGFFQAAHGGTLFLDEVGEASPEVQVLLLRVLETREVYPVGGHAPVPVDVRLVAATDANLEEQIQEGLFKAPLLHRLAGYEIHVPPLRERREDIGPLFLSFARQELEVTGEAWRLEQENPQAAPWLPASLAARLVRYAWPGNIRQLRNLARQLVVRSRGQPCLQADPRLEQELEGGAVPMSSQALAPALPEARAAPGTPRRKASEVGGQELLSALRESGWDLKAAASRLGISRASLYDLIERSPHVRTSKDLSPEEVTRCFHECQGDLESMVQRLEVSKRGLLRRVRELGLDASLP